MGFGFLGVKTSMAYNAVPVANAQVVIKDTNGHPLYTLKTDASGETTAVQLYAPDKIHTMDPYYQGAYYSPYQVEVRAPGFVTEIIKGVQIFDTVEAFEYVNMHPLFPSGSKEHVIIIPPHEQVLRSQKNQQGPPASRPRFGRAEATPVPGPWSEADPGSWSEADPGSEFGPESSPVSTPEEAVPVFAPMEAMQNSDPAEAQQQISDSAEARQISPISPFAASGRSSSIGARARRVIIPDFITVHLGRYNDTSARNVRVPFPFYIKNVASSEIFPTWPVASLEANIRAIINFALNRVYTEWYRGRGFNFDITSSTSTDMYFVDGRDIFTSIAVIVDQVMGEYLRRPNHNEPFFTEFCNGTTSTCPGMSQWGTVTLAEQGMTPMQILRYYYPNDLMIDTAPVASISESFPGIPLSQGTRGSDVQLMQKYLNRIRQNYPLIPLIQNTDGIFGTETANAVRTFQQITQLPQTSIIDRATWNKISFYYVAVTDLAELTSEGDRIILDLIPPNVVLRQGASGGYVSRLQYMLNIIDQVYPEVPSVRQDGAFGSGTNNAVIAFQRRFGLPADGVVGPATWYALYEVYAEIRNTLPPVSPPVTPPITPPPVTPPVSPPYPGTPLRVGSRGNNVQIMQKYLNALASVHPSIPSLATDGIFGPLTERAVIAFQRLFGLNPDGVIGPLTWNAIVTQYNNLANPAPPFPGYLLRQGSTGESVRIVQNAINRLAATHSSVPRVTVDGIFGPLTRNSVIAAQRVLGLSPDGIVGPITWHALVR